jgi:hypothetical protein
MTHWVNSLGRLAEPELVITILMIVIQRRMGIAHVGTQP